MEEHFVNYNQALALKELGFDEPCFGAYRSHSHFIGHLDIQYCTTNNLKQYEWLLHTLAPLKSQVFKWFRKVHKIHGSYGTTSDSREEINGYCISNFIDGNRNYLHINWEVGTYEEAESECIDKLISIIKEKKT